MDYVFQKLLARDNDSKKFEDFAIWMENNINEMGVQLTEEFYCDGMYDLSYQDTTESYIIEINTANSDFAINAKAELERLGVAEIRLLGLCKTVGELV